MLTSFTSSIANIRVTISNDAIKPNFVQVRRFELQHLVDASTVDDIRSLSYFFRSTIGASEASLDELLTIFVEQVKSREMSARGDLDELGKTVPDLRFWQGTQKAKVQEGVHRSMIGAQPILVVAIVDRHLD